jgi:hypothetical protein
MKYGAYEDLNRHAWERNEIGIWYGAWGATELNTALQGEDPLTYLSKVNKKRGLDWEISANCLNTAKRFSSISPRDWVLLYFEGTICLAHIRGEVRTSPDHELNRKGELFKYRKINSKKSFSLNRLPDAFRVLRSAGRGNVFHPRGGGELVKLLGDAETESDVTKALKSKPLDEALDLLGPTTWESVCHAYLAMKHQFVPVGLATGGTLADVDIAGRRRRDGARILAQCKKNPNPDAIAEGFLEAIADLGKNDMAFYFTYGGCSGTVPSRVTVVDRDAIRRWSKTGPGARYFGWLFGANPVR